MQKVNIIRVLGKLNGRTFNEQWMIYLPFVFNSSETSLFGIFRKSNSEIQMFKSSHSKILLQRHSFDAFMVKNIHDSSLSEHAI